MKYRGFYIERDKGSSGWLISEWFRDVRYYMGWAESLSDAKKLVDRELYVPYWGSVTLSELDKDFRAARIERLLE